MTRVPALSRRQMLATALAASAAGSAASAARAATGRVTDTVRITFGLNGLPLIAKQRGAFAEQLKQDGITVEWLGPFPNHAPTIQAVAGGSADFSFGGSTTPALAAILGGSPLIFSQFCVVEPRTTAIIARAGSGIDKVTDLAGKSVAVNRSGLAEFLLVAALEKYHVDRSKVKFVYLNPPEAAPAFGAGQVDCWAMWSPQVDIARAQFNGHDIFLEGRDLDFQIDFNSWIVAQDFAEKNPALVRAVNAAFIAEAAWASANPIEAETIAQKQAKYSDDIRDMFIGWKRRYEIKPVTDAAFLAELQKAADWLSARNILPEPITIREHLVHL